MPTLAGMKSDASDSAVALYMRFLRDTLTVQPEGWLSPNDACLLEAVVLRWHDQQPMTVNEAIHLQHLGSPATLHKRLTRLRKMGLLTIEHSDQDRRTKYLVSTPQALDHFHQMGLALQKALDTQPKELELCPEN